MGPSGSGKSTVARQWLGDALVGNFAWPQDQAVVDGFDAACSSKAVAHMLSAVGFSSPPSWVKPYHVLSNGERFRCDLARALLLDQPLVAFDEFTSVVDRVVAKIGSAAVAKAIRKKRIATKFVAVTCHYDVAEWLTPDWVLDMASCRLARGCLQRPAIRLQVAPVHHSAWDLFRRHHYLNTSISTAAKCWVAFWDNQPVAFSSWLSFGAGKNLGVLWREHRTVVLPDYQGIGIGNRVSELCASILVGVGKRACSTTSHPAMIRHRSASALWKRHRLSFVTGSTRPKERSKARDSSSRRRITGGFHYVGPAMNRDVAEQLWNVKPRTYRYPENAVRLMKEIERHPGSTNARLSRVTAMDPAATRSVLARLVADGEIRRLGGGGRRDPIGFYPRE